MIIQRVTCDGPQCTSVKQRANHWFWLTRWEDSISFGQGDHPKSNAGKRIFDLCGQQCLIAVINEIINPKPEEAKEAGR